MAITTLPPSPSRNDADTVFVSKADALIAALPLFVTESNALQVDVNTKSTTATTAATTATNAATSATNSATSAAASANTATTVVAGSVGAAAASATSAASSAATATQAKLDALAAINQAALVEDYGLITEAVTAIVDYGVF